MNNNDSALDQAPQWRKYVVTRLWLLIALLVWVGFFWGSHQVSPLYNIFLIKHNDLLGRPIVIVPDYDFIGLWIGVSIYLFVAFLKGRRPLLVWLLVSVLLGFVIGTYDNVTSPY
ncbi:hypothetical protein HC928_03920 [bacterium]|nr:hypothetical protein [bacterium]